MSDREAPPSHSPAAADLVLMNGRIATLDARRSFAQAIAIGAGRVLATGDDRTIAEIGRAHV